MTRSYLTASDTSKRYDYDTVLLVSGRVLHAHRLILARRSATFRELIMLEEWPGEGALLELLLPDLRYDVASAIIQYIYTDNLFFTLDFRSSLPAELLVASKTYQLPRLEAMCRSAILSTSGEHGLQIHMSPPRPPMRKTQQMTMMNIPRSEIPTDFGGGVGDASWADVKFVAGGRPIYAHRFILMNRSEYFDAMFRCGMKEGSLTLPGPAAAATTARARTVDIVVPDSYESMLRLLLFIYSGNLPDRITTDNNDSDAILEDLMAADRYRLLELTELCESLVDVSNGNCLDVLQVADIYGAKRLREAALLHIVRHLDSVASSPAFRGFAVQHPGLMDEIFDKIKATSPLTTALADEHPDDGTAAGDKEGDKEDDSFDPGPFPWMPLGGLVACGIIYSQLSQMVALGPLIPLINILFVAGLIAYVMYTQVWQ